MFFRGDVPHTRAAARQRSGPPGLWAWLTADGGCRPSPGSPAAAVVLGNCGLAASLSGPYLAMPFSLSHPAAASFALCFWSPLTARLRLMRSSVVRVLDTLFRASLALSVILALLKRGSTCCALKLFLGSSSTTRSLSAMDGVVV